MFSDYREGYEDDSESEKSITQIKPFKQESSSHPSNGE